MIIYLLSLLLLPVSLIRSFSSPAGNQEPVRIAVAGLTHGHVHWIFGRLDVSDIEIAGIYEPDRELWEQFKSSYNLDEELYFSDLDEMLDTTAPEGVTAFGSTYDHLTVAQAAAPRGIHIMVEKPLAVNMVHAIQMQELATRHNVHLITNYETTWYASNHYVYDQFRTNSRLGEVRKVVVHDGHQGPKEIGVGDEFLEWLVDPVLNGGGAIMDFGCYGANLITWLMDGEAPESVTAVTQTHKPHIYGQVDDEATVIVTYPGVQGVIQASWNWPYSRKDMQVYGESGYVYAQDGETVQIMEKPNQLVTEKTLEPLSHPYNGPFSYFASVIRGTAVVEDTDLSSLENNMTVIKILDAARESARTGKTINLKEN